jgi:hypothetical protein
VDHQARQAAAHRGRGVCRGGHRHGVKFPQQLCVKFPQQLGVKFWQRNSQEFFGADTRLTSDPLRTRPQQGMTVLCSCRFVKQQGCRPQQPCRQGRAFTSHAVADKVRSRPLWQRLALCDCPQFWCVISVVGAGPWHSGAACSQCAAGSRLCVFCFAANAEGPFRDHSTWDHLLSKVTLQAVTLQCTQQASFAHALSADVACMAGRLRVVCDGYSCSGCSCAPGRLLSTACTSV